MKCKCGEQYAGAAMEGLKAAAEHIAPSAKTSCAHCPVYAHDKSCAEQRPLGKKRHCVPMIAGFFMMKAAGQI